MRKISRKIRGSDFRLSGIVPITGVYLPFQPSYILRACFKKVDIMVMAVKYKNYIPKRVFDALMRYEVKPYVEDFGIDD